MSKQFVVGEVYFRVKYAEASRRFPLFDSFVFVGINLSDEDTEDTWYFQFADSYAKSGSILDPNSGDDRRVSCLTANDTEEMLNDEQLLIELDRARRRRSNQAG
jgi:hypothetical protein